MSECELCRQGDPAITVRCHNCRETFHIHQCQVDMAPADSLLMADCPRCRTINCWMKQQGKVKCSGLVVYYGQPIMDLRGKYGAGR